MSTRLRLGTDFQRSYSAAKPGIFNTWTPLRFAWIQVLVLRSMWLCYSPATVFTHSFKRDVRAPLEIPLEEIYADGVERRVLSKERYDLSRRFLPALVKDLGSRTIRCAREDSVNFFTAEDAGADPPGVYVVFFEVRRDKRRKRRLLLYIQSAYWLDGWAGKDNGHTKVAVACEALYRVFARTPTPGGTRLTGRHCLLHSLVADLHLQYRDRFGQVKPPLGTRVNPRCYGSKSLI